MEDEVFLVSEAGESYLGTVEELLHPKDPYAEGLSFNSEIVDLVNMLVFDENHLSNKIIVSIELREPRIKQNGI